MLVALLRDRSVVAFSGGDLGERALLLPGSGPSDKAQEFHLAVTAVRSSESICPDARLLVVRRLY